MLDPIADMLTRIRNAQMVKLKLSIAKILEQRNFIESVKKEMGETFPVLRIVLRYEVVSNTEKNPAISEIKRVSRQGQRIYVKKTDIKRVKNGYGISVISTSQGMMTGDKAKKLGLGGEVICEVW
ncbi:MAG: 30S ribosomal protein S8 [Candidatus Moranbacteria bacterium GW2011_GWC2_37_73]|nr:MAG: 30S ribosomal protein S8 [Candidatus Moranbacteria bacterium GW2011_GWC2_37_73]